MDHIFKAVQTRISEMVPEVKWIDYDFGQLEHYSMRPSVQFPCALIDIELPECSDMGKLAQNCKCTVTIRLAFEPLGQTNNKTNQKVHDKAMELFRTVDKIFAAIHGFSGADFNKILRRSITTERREDNYKVLNMRFDTSYVASLEPKYKEVTLTPVVTVQE